MRSPKTLVETLEKVMISVTIILEQTVIWSLYGLPSSLTNFNEL